MKILFVCLGNICRSPSAEAVFRRRFDQLGLNAFFDSAATSNYRIGHRSDPRSILHAEKRGYQMTHLGRQVCEKDFANFDYIFAMDDSNLKNLFQICPENLRHKVSLLTAFAKNKKHTHVPDPYHGGVEDFELVLNIIEDCVDPFIEHLKERKRI